MPRGCLGDLKGPQGELAVVPRSRRIERSERFTNCMAGRVFVMAGDRDMQGLLVDQVQKSGLDVIYPTSVSLMSIQDSADFVVVGMTDFETDARVPMILTGYALGVGKPVILVTWETSDFVIPRVIKDRLFARAYLNGLHNTFSSLLLLIKPLCGLSLLSEKVAESIALIQNTYGVEDSELS